ncbi:TRAF3-interacting protein 1 [Thrips palmi]|uniref:TRAF3-interacting protein 1 n=1 Tax=Thrips palmi TaxID=161013 RepID=A0A6P9AI51_THRPL|nr:TRAF3-interacting protein 1 [Thrips palmi]
MAEEVKPEVIKKTQDSLKRHIKKPPLTEKLLKKPPFRFLHDIITSVIRETGFLNGLFSQEELNHENIKDRDGKIAFLDKLISAVKIITGIPLSVRATKIVAGHEATKTNELLQAIGHALDKKLDSKDVAQQLRKKGNKKSDASDSKKSSPREAKQGSEASKERAVNQPDESLDKKKHSSNKQVKDVPASSQDEPTEKKKRSSSTSKSKPKDTSKAARPKKDGTRQETKSDPQKESENNNEPDASQIDVPSATKQESATARNGTAEPERKRPSSASRRPSISRQQSEGHSQEHQREQQPQSAATAVPPVPVKNDSQDSLHENGTSLTSLPPLTSEPAKGQAAQPPAPAARAPSAAPAPVQAPAPAAPAPVPLARPRTAARVGSARPGAPRVRNRGEAVVVSEDLIKPAPVNLIVEDDNAKQQNDDEDENLVVVENASLDGPESIQPSAPVLSRPSSQQGHLVAQILETQKELEVGATIAENGDVQQFHTEIEWEAGKRRERETAVKEVDRMRTLIQTLTRAAHPLGKLLDSLQEDVDNMQRELTQWQNMQVSLEQQLQVEETLSTQASQPLKEQLKQLQQAVRSQLDQIGSAKSNIFNNDDRIKRLLTGGLT